MVIFAFRLRANTSLAVPALLWQLPGAFACNCRLLKQTISSPTSTCLKSFPAFILLSCAQNGLYYSFVLLGNLASLALTVRATIAQNTGVLQPPRYGQIIKVRGACIRCRWRCLCYLLIYGSVSLETDLVLHTSFVAHPDLHLVHDGPVSRWCVSRKCCTLVTEITREKYESCAQELHARPTRRLTSIIHCIPPLRSEDPDRVAWRYQDDVSLDGHRVQLSGVFLARLLSPGKRQSIHEGRCVSRRVPGALCSAP